MANIKSQIKRIKTNEIARKRNVAVKSALKTSVRRFRSAADAGDPQATDCHVGRWGDPVAEWNREWPRTPTRRSPRRS